MKQLVPVSVWFGTLTGEVADVALREGGQSVGLLGVHLWMVSGPSGSCLQLGRV